MLSDRKYVRCVRRARSRYSHASVPGRCERDSEQMNHDVVTQRECRASCARVWSITAENSRAYLRKGLRV